MRGTLVASTTRRGRRRAEEVRAAAARLIGAQHGRGGIRRQYLGRLVDASRPRVDWRPGDSVVAVDGEFPANVYPWWALERLGVETRLARIVERPADGRRGCEARRSTRRASSASAPSTSQPVSAVRWPRSASSVVARGCCSVSTRFKRLGALRIDVERDGIDALAADGHKWLVRAGGLRRPLRVATLARPPRTAADRMEERRRREPLSAVSLRAQGGRAEIRVRQSQLPRASTRSGRALDLVFDGGRRRDRAPRARA